MTCSGKERRQASEPAKTTLTTVVAVVLRVAVEVRSATATPPPPTGGPVTSVDDASRRMEAENLYEALAPGGFICLGHTESMSRISPLFDARRFEDAIIYQRPQEGVHV